MRNLINLFEDDNEIKEICKKYKLDFNKVTQNSDGTIDYDGHVYLRDMGLTKIPLQFNHVTDYFSCSNNPALKSLIDSPKIVNGYFNCSNNPGLESLVGGPTIVDGDFNCSNNSDLESLIGGPKIVGGDFDCYSNPGLESLVGGPKKVSRDYLCSRCKNLKSLKGVAKFISGDFYCTYTPNLSPREMSWLLFSEIHKKIKTGNDATDAIFAKYHGKKEMIGQAVKELREIS